MSNIKEVLIENEVDVLEQNTEVAPEHKKGFCAWVKNHKTQLIFV